MGKGMVSMIRYTPTTPPEINKEARHKGEIKISVSFFGVCSHEVFTTIAIQYTMGRRGSKRRHRDEDHDDSLEMEYYNRNKKQQQKQREDKEEAQISESKA